MAGIPLALNFDLGAPLPLDSRIVIAQFSQLNNINPKYSGMQVYAADTKKLYYLEDLPSNKWTEVITNSNLPSLPTSLVYTTGNQTIDGVKTFSNTIGGSINGNAATVTNGVYTIGNQTIGGEKTFSTRPKVGTSGVLLQGEIPSLPSTLVYTTGNQEIGGEKIFKDLTNFTNSVLVDTNRWFVNQYFTGFSGDDNNDTSFGATVATSNDGTILFTHSNSFVYVYARNTIEQNFSFLERFRVSGSEYRVSSLHFNNDTSSLFVGGILYNTNFDVTGENIFIFTGRKDIGWNNLNNIITGQIFGGIYTQINTNKNNDILVISSTHDDEKGIDAGAIFLYTGSSQNNWRLKQKIVPPGPNLNYQYFGSRLDLSSNGNTLFVTDFGDLNQNKLRIYTGSKTSTYVLKQTIDMPFVDILPPWGNRYDRLAGISCNPDASKFVFVKSKLTESNSSYINIYTGNNNIGWGLEQEIEGIAPWNWDSSIVINDNSNTIILGDTLWGGSQGALSVYTLNTDNNNWRLSEFITPNLFPFSWPNEPSPSQGIRMGQGRLGFSIAINSDASFLVAGGPRAPIVQFGDGRGYFVTFKSTQQSLKVNSQEPNSPLIDINGIISINSAFRPTYNNSGILVQGEAIEANSDAQLNSLKFKNSSEFNSPYFISNYISGGTIQNPNLPNISIFSDLIGDLVSFTTTGTLFKDRPYVNGSGVLLQGESVISSPSLDPFFGNRPIRRLPVADTNYGGTTISGFLTNLFFPYLNTTIGLNPFSIYTYGIDSLSSINFSSTITSNDDTVTGLAAFRGLSRVGGIDPISVNGTQTISQTATLSPNVIATTTSSCLSRVYITRSGVSTNIASNNLAIRFEPRYYFGLSANTSLTSGEIAQLQNIVGPNTNPNFYSYAINAKPSNVTTTFNNPTNQYLYLAYPGEDIAGDLIKDWGIVSSIVDTITFQQYTNEFQAMPNIQINLGTKTLTYRVYRSKLIWNIAAQFNLQFNL